MVPLQLRPGLALLWLPVHLDSHGPGAVAVCTRHRASLRLRRLASGLSGPAAAAAGSVPRLTNDPARTLAPEHWHHVLDYVIIVTVIRHRLPPVTESLPGPRAGSSVTPDPSVSLHPRIRGYESGAIALRDPFTSGHRRWRLRGATELRALPTLYTLLNFFVLLER